MHKVKRVNIALVTAGIMVFTLSVLIHVYIFDDAFISFRYAENFARGYGLVFNPGERVEGYSNPLFVLVLSPFIKWGSNPEIVSRVLGLLSGLGSIFLVWRIQKKS